MLDLTRIFSGQGTRAQLTKDEIAKLLNATPEALEAFEEAYAAGVLEEKMDSFFDINSRQAALLRDRATGTNDERLVAEDLVGRIVDELLYQSPTRRFIYDGHGGRYETFAVSGRGKPVSNADLQCLPQAARPQLTGFLAKKDIESSTYQEVLGAYAQYLHETDPKKKRLAYHLFRQGLDILDLDPVLPGTI